MVIVLLSATAVLAAAVLVLALAVLRTNGRGGAAPLLARFDAMERGQERQERALRDEIARHREETTAALRGFNDSMVGSLTGISGLQKDELARLRAAVEQGLRVLQEDNAAKLDQMRRTVDEKLEGTLEKRLGESFKLVSERLEQVHSGLGEMKSLAAGVGDLKKVLANVKTRGTWGEVQLGSLLEQVLQPDQYARNVSTTGSAERVEFAIRLPGRDGADGAVWLPVDAKFPQEDYLRLAEAAERGDADGMDAAARQLEARVKGCARDIRDKYLAPPKTTDFGIMFLPTEGLYAEVLRRPGLCEALNRDYRVTVAGPATICAFLNSLQMGFQTLAIQEKSSEVWKVLGQIKTEFGKYSDALARIHKKLEEASHSVEQAEVRTRAINRTLRSVETLPSGEPETLLEG